MDERDSTYSAAVDDYLRCHLVRGGQCGREPHLAWFLTGAPVPELNQVLWVSAETHDMARALEANRFTLWNVWPGLTPSNLERLLVSSGLSFIEEEAVMTRVIDSSRSHLPAVEGVTIREVTTTTELRKWAATWQPATRDGARREIVAALGAAGFGSGTCQRFLAAEEDGHTVGCALVVSDGRGAAALEHVATRRTHRNRGIGTLLTQAGIHIAQDSGAQRIVLTASSDGRRIYERAGFVEVGRVRRFGNLPATQSVG